MGKYLLDGKLTPEGEEMCESLLPEITGDKSANMAIAHQTLAAKFPAGEDRAQLADAILTYLAGFLGGTDTP